MRSCAHAQNTNRPAVIVTMMGRKRRRSHVAGGGAPPSLGLQHVRALAAVLLAGLAVTNSSPAASDQAPEANDTNIRSAGTRNGQLERIGEALDLPIDEPAASQESGEDMMAPDLLHLTEENFVSTFQDMFRTDDEELPAENDAILCLLAVYSPDCRACEPVLRSLNHLSERLDVDYNKSIVPRWAGADGMPPPSRPVVGMINGSNVTHEFYTKLEPLTAFPSLKFALVQRLPKQNGGDQRAAGDERRTTVNSAAPEVTIQMFDYIGSGPAHVIGDIDGLIDSIWHYWYRYVAARQTDIATANDALDENADQEEGAKQYPPVFSLPSLQSAVSFLKNHGGSILKPVPSHMPVQLNEEERQYYSDLLKPAPEEEDGGLGEPMTIFFQCRPQDDDTRMTDKRAKRLYSKFDALAEELVNRRDVAFFVVKSHTNHQCAELVADTDGESIFDGTVAVIRTTDVSLIEIEQKASAVYVPPTAENGAKDTMTQFVITHTTPTILLFDRNFAADYAFPFYRTLHAVLFIDTPELGSPASERRQKRNREITDKSRHAIRLFRQAAVNHRHHARPDEDIVFIIVPSYEKRVFNLFGVDIWTGLDRKFSAVRDLARSIDTQGAGASTEEDSTEQSCEAEDEVVPTMMLTSRSSPTNRSERVVTKRYYLSANDILYGDENVMSRFIANYFAGILQPAIQSQPTPANRTNDDGVQLLTGDTFKELVLEQNNRHTLVNFFSATCGHCKRFNVIWNQLGRLVRVLNWHETVDVMKMDLTRNELPLDNLSIWQYPSVYYFPANEKENAIPMNVEGDASYGDLDLRGYDLVEWLFNQDKFDKQELMELHRIGLDSKEVVKKVE